MLQHAWAEIEHDLGYKSPESVPATVRRRFSRLAGLLEIADDEFASIRDEVARYTAGIATIVRDNPDEAGIDRDSIVAYVTSSPIARAVDERLLAAFAAPGIEEIPGPYASFRAKELTEVGFDSIAAVNSALREKADFILGFARAWIGRPGRDEPDFDQPLTRGISLFYLYLVSLAERVEAGETVERGAGLPLRTTRFGELGGESLMDALRVAYGEAGAIGRATAAIATPRSRRQTRG